MAYLKTLIGATLTIAVSGRSTEEVKMVHMNERQVGCRLVRPQIETVANDIFIFLSYNTSGGN